MNKYLEKVAGFGKYISQAGDFAEHVIGNRAAALRRDADAMARHAAAGLSAADVQGLAAAATKQTRDARIKAGLGAGAIGATGLLGIHKYHQYKDRAIMDRLNRMYSDPNFNQST